MTDTNYRIAIGWAGGEITISPDAPLRLLAGGLLGFDSTDYDVAAEAYADDHGGYIKRRRFGARELVIVFEIAENDEIWRRRILSVVNPGHDCEVMITMSGVTRRITAVAAGRVTFRRETFFDKTTAEIRFLAPDPFLRSDKALSGAFRRRVPLLTFPMNFHGKGLTAGQLVHVDHGTAENTGDVPCGLIITVRASGGDVVNPAVFLGDACFRATVTLLAGDEMLIDTRRRHKGIRINGESSLSFDWKSSFFSLEVGDNTLRFDADSGKENMAVSYAYEPLYLGI